MSNRKAASLALCTFFLALLCATGTAWSSAGPGTLELSASSYSAAPGTTAVFITVVRTGGSSGSAVAQYGTFDGTAIAGRDYTATSGTMTWSDGESNPKSLVVPIAAGAASTKSFKVSLLMASGATFGTPINATVAINPGAAAASPGTLELSASSYSAAPGTAAVFITVVRSGGSSGSVVAQYGTFDGTALAGTDYAATTGTLTWSDGESNPKSFAVPIAAGAASAKSFKVSLLTSSGATFGTPINAIVSINAAAAAASPGTLELSASSYSAAPGTAAVFITAVRTGGSGGSVVAQYGTFDGTAVAGTDYTATSGTLTWSDGDSNPKSFVVPIAAGAATPKSFKVSLLTSSGATFGTPINATVSIDASGQAGGVIKWNPGHYLASDSILYPGATLSDVTPELDDINGYDNILGDRVLITWAALEPTQGNYNFSLLDAILNRLKTHYNKPKHLVLVVLPGPFGNTTVDASVVPQYIQTNGAYGASPVSASYGWWGQNSGTSAATYGYVAALHRPAVMDRYIALVQALGAHYDSEPYFEALMFQEDAWMVSLLQGAPDYSDAAFVTQLQRLLTAATAAFPHTSVAMQNTWLQYPSGTQSFEQWMIANRIAPASSDTVGQSAFTNYNYANDGLAWGLQAYMGIQTSGDSWTPIDMRSQARAMMDIEGPDIAGTYFAGQGAAEGFQPLDIIAALNQTYRASHAFWTHYFGAESVWPGSGTVSQVSPWAVWSALAPVINAHPLTSTAYPPSYFGQ